MLNSDYLYRLPEFSNKMYIINTVQFHNSYVLCKKILGQKNNFFLKRSVRIHVRAKDSRIISVVKLYSLRHLGDGKIVPLLRKPKNSIRRNIFKSISVLLLLLYGFIDCIETIIGKEFFTLKLKTGKCVWIEITEYNEKSHLSVNVK